MSDVIKDTDTKMQKALDALRKNFAGIRTGRAQPALLDTVQVDYYGTTMPLKQMSQVSAPDAKSLLVTPYDKNAMQAIEKAIMSANLGLTPKTESGVIRLILPELSQERRKELAKFLKKEAEDAKVAVRNVRRDAIDEIKKQKSDKVITEDVERALDKKVQELTDRYSVETDKALAVKEKEIMEV